MRIKLTDDNTNWLNWGKLVNLWIEDSSKRPDSVGALRQQLRDNTVDATVEGTDERAVVVQPYLGNADTLLIMIPNRAMRDKRLAEDIHPEIPGPYPLPLFYDTIFGGAQRALLSSQEKLDMALRRIGEYTINECC